MKLFKKITGAVVAIALVLTAVFAFAISGEKTSTNYNTATEKIADGPGDYYFNGTDYTDKDSWGEMQNTEFTCGANSELPCKITVPTGYTLQEYLDEHAANILAVSDGERVAAP